MSDKDQSENQQHSQPVGVECGVRLRREPTDTEMLDWLAQQVFYPGDTPTNGVFAAVSDDYAPNGKFTGDPVNDAAQFRAAIKQAMFE